MDSRFRIAIVSAMPNPQQTVWAAMHQDYSSNFVMDEALPEEKLAGEIAIKRLLQGDRGHYGPLEHPQIVISCGYFPHSTVQQLRTHRIASFDVQSFRYTSEALIGAARGRQDVEDVVYFRPVGEYRDRDGKKYEYTTEMRKTDKAVALDLLVRYADKIELGRSEEHARGVIPFDVRQHFVMSVNARSLMHLLDLRAKADAQLECQWFCDLLMDVFRQWMPEVASWYEKNRFKKARLAP